MMLMTSINPKSAKLGSSPLALDHAPGFDSFKLFSLPLLLRKGSVTADVRRSISAGDFINIYLKSFRSPIHGLSMRIWLMAASALSSSRRGRRNRDPHRASDGGIKMNARMIDGLGPPQNGR